MTQLDKEKKTFYLICLYHIIVWTILPFLANKNLPLDTIEALAWGGSFDLGYNKHPPLSAWITGLLFKFFGNKDFIYYLLSQLFIVLALIYVRKIAKIFLKKKISITLSFLILESIAFFNFETPQFNVNICQIPFWIMTIYFFLKGIEKIKFEFNEMLDIIDFSNKEILEILSEKLPIHLWGNKYYIENDKLYRENYL